MTDLVGMFDPHAAHDRWIKEHTWRIDLVPDLIYVIVEATLPQIPVGLGSRFDGEQLTGGGYVDSMRMLDRIDTGAALDAREFWTEVYDYHQAAVRAVVKPSRPAPVLSPHPDADPLSARGTALLAVGGLIDHGEHIASAPVLDREPDALYVMIRHLRGRYGVFQHPRRQPLERCNVCGEVRVETRWATSKDGRARSVEVKRCAHCGHEIREDEGTAA